MTEDPQTVYVTENYAGHKFHVDPECPSGPRDPRAWSRPKAERNGFEACRRCSPAHQVDYATQGRSLRDRLATGEIDAEEGEL